MFNNIYKSKLFWYTELNLELIVIILFLQEILKGNELIQVAKDYGGILSIDYFKEMHGNSTRSGCDFFMIDLQNKDVQLIGLGINFNCSLVNSRNL